MTTGEKIKELRENQGMTQLELAHRVGYTSKSSINKIEMGDRNLPLKKLNLIAKVLGVSTDYLIGTRKLTDDEMSLLHSRFMDAEYMAALPEGAVPCDAEQRLTGELHMKELAPATGTITRRVNGVETIIDINKIDKISYSAPDNAMLLEGIPKGASLSLLRQQPKDGNIVMLVIDGEHILRRFCRKGDIILLTCSNPRYEPIAIEPAVLSQEGNGILGVVKKVTVEYDV